MNSQKLQIKIFCKGETPDLEPLIGVFQEWIRVKQVPDEVLVDAADYTHMPGGPGVLLVGHGTDYYLDEGVGGAAGMMVSRKRAFEGTFASRLRDTLRRTLEACQTLENDSSLEQSFVFATDEIFLRIPDRLHAPNEASTLHAIRSDVTEVLMKAFGTAPTEMIREGESEREPFSIRIRCPEGKTLAELLEAVGR